MRKFVIILIIISACIFLVSPTQSVSAQDNLEYTTIYPENIYDYVDLTNISHIGLNEQFIAYTLDRQTLTIFDKNARTYRHIEGFDNISKLTYCKDKLLIADANFIRILTADALDIDQLHVVNQIELDNFSAIDIHSNDTEIFVGIVAGDTFKLYKSLISDVNSHFELDKTCAFSYFNTTYMLAINDTTANIVTNISAPKLYVLKFNQSTPEEIVFKANSQLIDCFTFQGNPYILTFTQEILYLLKDNGDEVCSVNISLPGGGGTNTSKYPIQELTDLVFFDGLIYVSDQKYKTIQSFEIETQDSTTRLIAHEILLCSASSALGRFNNANNIFVQGSTIFVSDTDNNRIQIIENNFVTTEIESGSAPRSVTTDINQNMYFVRNDLIGSILTRYRKINEEYSYVNSYSLVNSSRIGYLSDIAITNSNMVYMLDYTNDNLLCLSSSELTVKKSLPIDIGESSKIKYLKSLNQLVVLNDNQLYLFTLNGDLLSNILISNSTDIAVNLSTIYVLTNNTIKVIDARNNDLTIDTVHEIFDPTLAKFSTIYYDIPSGIFYGFNQQNHCLETFDGQMPSPFNFQEPFALTSLNSTNYLKPITIINNHIIYQLPYFMGEAFNLNQETSTCFAIEEYESFYRVLFNQNNRLQIGFIQKVNGRIESFTEKINKVITTNQTVSIYKYPTLLKNDNTSIVVGNLPINTSIRVYGIYPVSIDNKTFYLYKSGTNIGFVFNADIVLDESKNIAYLKHNNATIKLIGIDQAIVYSTDFETEMLYLHSDERIHVENFDKNSQYTKIIYKTSELETIEGYILTEYIQMDNLDASKIIILSMLAVALILFAIIIIVFVNTRKHKK